MPALPVRTASADEPGRLIMVAAEKGIDHVDTEAAEHEVINALEKEFFPHIDEKE